MKHSSANVSPQPTSNQHERRQLLTAALAAVNEVLLGKPEQVRLAFACLLARGHLLIEDIPGVGKTTLARALATVTGARYQRVQFTSDLMPADIVGLSVYRRDEERFEFHPGPIFADLLLADEVNRATPKTQSALLEAMAENQVTVEGTTHALPDPFFVIATQNPLDMIGTYPLPDSQLDRFLLSVSLGLPSPEFEKQLLLGEDRAHLLARMEPLLDQTRLKLLQQDCNQVRVSDPLLAYLQTLLAATRNQRWFQHGLSPRAGLALLRCARAHAFIEARDFVAPEDIKAVFPGLVRHRLTVIQGQEGSAEEQALKLLTQVPVP